MNWRRSNLAEYYIGIDPAKTHDFLGIVVLAKEGNEIKLIAMKELQLDYTIAADYIESLYNKYHTRFIFCDETGIGKVFVDMLRAKHLKTEGIILTNSSKVQIIENAVKLMQQGRLKLPLLGASELKQQLQEQERSMTATGLPKFIHKRNTHDDLFWAFIIGIFGIKIDRPELVIINASRLEESKDGRIAKLNKENEEGRTGIRWETK